MSHQRKQNKAEMSNDKIDLGGPTEMSSAFDDVETPITEQEVALTMLYAKERNWNGTVDSGLSSRWWVYDDCCGLVCAIITIGLHCFAYWAQWVYIFKPWLGLFSLPHFLYTFLVFMAVASHTRAQFTAPGVVPAKCTPPTKPNLQFDDPKEEERLNTYYKNLYSRYTHHRTGTIKPRTSHYCHEVDAVVIKMDHYCPWVNNVVALFTQKYFLLFVFYTCLTCIFCGVTLGGRFLSCYRANQRSKYSGWQTSQKTPDWCRPDTTDTVVSICNVVEAIIFGIFTIAMGCDQAEAIAENTNYIDRLQKKKDKNKLYCNPWKIFGVNHLDGNGLYHFHQQNNCVKRFKNFAKRLGLNWLSLNHVLKKHFYMMFNNFV